MSGKYIADSGKACKRRRHCTLVLVALPWSKRSRRQSVAPCNANQRLHAMLAEPPGIAAPYLWSRPKTSISRGIMAGPRTLRPEDLPLAGPWDASAAGTAVQQDAGSERRCVGMASRVPGMPPSPHQDPASPRIT